MLAAGTYQDRIVFAKQYQPRASEDHSEGPLVSTKQPEGIVASAPHSSRCQQTRAMTPHGSPSGAAEIIVSLLDNSSCLDALRDCRVCRTEKGQWYDRKVSTKFRSMGGNQTLQAASALLRRPRLSPADAAHGSSLQRPNRPRMWGPDRSILAAMHRSDIAAPHDGRIGDDELV